MGLYNIISGLLKTTCTECHILPKSIESRNVIGEMTEKYGNVDTTPKDITIIKDEIAKRKREQRNNSETRPSNRSRCKISEDAYNNREVELRSELCILNTLYRRVVTGEVNKFPLNKACTIKYIADYIGVKESVIWYILVIDNEVSSYLYCSDRYSMNVKHISDTEINIRVRSDNEYSQYGFMCNDEQVKIHNMILPNWRFVESTDPSIFYVERTS